MGSAMNGIKIRRLFEGEINPKTARKAPENRFRAHRSGPRLSRRLFGNEGIGREQAGSIPATLSNHAQHSQNGLILMPFGSAI